MFAKFRAASITAICMPKQIPRYGILFSRAYLAALILPSVPRSPKPPGTNTAWKPDSVSVTLPASSNISASIHSSFTFTRLNIPP